MANTLFNKVLWWKWIMSFSFTLKKTKGNFFPNSVHYQNIIDLLLHNLCCSKPKIVMQIKSRNLILWYCELLAFCPKTGLPSSMADSLLLMYSLHICGPVWAFYFCTVICPVSGFPVAPAGKESIYYGDLGSILGWEDPEKGKAIHQQCFSELYTVRNICFLGYLVCEYYTNVAHMPEVAGRLPIVLGLTDGREAGLILVPWCFLVSMLTLACGQVDVQF